MGDPIETDLESSLFLELNGEHILIQHGSSLSRYNNDLSPVGLAVDVDSNLIKNGAVLNNSNIAVPFDVDDEMGVPSFMIKVFGLPESWL